MGIAKEVLSLAGEYAVASELSRRGVYAQLTLATRKRTDLLVETDEAMLRVQVKAKQGRTWPLIKGISGADTLLILVDYEHKAPEVRPDFYVLTSDDWKNFVSSGWVAKDVSEGRFTLTNEYVVKGVPKDKSKQGWKGINIDTSDISQHKEQWGKVQTLMNKGK